MKEKSPTSNGNSNFHNNNIKMVIKDKENVILGKMDSKEYISTPPLNTLYLIVQNLLYYIEKYINDFKPTCLKHAPPASIIFIFILSIIMLSYIIRRYFFDIPNNPNKINYKLNLQNNYIIWSNILIGVYIFIFRSNFIGFKVYNFHRYHIRLTEIVIINLYISFIMCLGLLSNGLKINKDLRSIAILFRSIIYLFSIVIIPLSFYNFNNILKITPYISLLTVIVPCFIKGYIYYYSKDKFCDIICHRDLYYQYDSLEKINTKIKSKNSY